MIGFPFGPASDRYTPREHANLAIWLDAADPRTLFQDSTLATAVDADGQPVGGWLDKSGAFRHVTRATAVRRPTYRSTGLNGMPTLEFDGVDDWLGATGWTLPQPLTLFVVASRSVAAGHLLDGGAVTGRVVLYVPSSNFAMNAGSDVAGAAWDSSAHVHAGVVNGASSSYRIDGAATAGNAGTASMEGISIGCNYGGNSRLTGKVSEILVYARVLSAYEISRVESYLKRKWGTA